MRGSTHIKEVQEGMERGKSRVEKEGGASVKGKKISCQWEEGKRGGGKGKDNQEYFYTLL